MVVPGSPSELPDHADVRNPNGQNKKLIGGKMKKSVLFVLVVLMLALISTAAGAQYKDTLTWAQGSDVTSLDPHQGKETPAVQVTSQIFDTLVAVDPATNELFPS